MGYFDGLTDASFKKDKKGNSVFYPFGICFGGYILPPEKQDKIRTAIKRYYIFSFPLSVILGVCLLSYIHIILLIPALMVLYVIGMKILLKGLKKSEDSLTFSESMTNSARSYSEGNLWLCEIISLGFVAMGIYKIAASATWYFGAFVTLFGGVCATFFGKMITVKNKITHNKGSETDRE